MQSVLRFQAIVSNFASSQQLGIPVRPIQYHRVCPKVSRNCFASPANLDSLVGDSGGRKMIDKFAMTTSQKESDSMRVKF